MITINVIFYHKQTLTLEHQIDWLCGKPPLTEPKCGLSGEKCVYKPNWKIITPGLVLLLILLPVLILIVRYLHQSMTN